VKGLIAFVWTTIVGGFAVVLPVVLVVYLVGEAVGALEAITEPVSALLPVEELGGIELATLLAVLITLTGCFVAGLLARLSFASRASTAFERAVLDRLPGYVLVKSLTRRFTGTGEGARFAPALARLADGDAWVLAFIVEEHESGDFTVLVPVAPTPTMGLLYLVGGEDVRRLDVPMSAAVNCVMQWGVGSRQLFRATHGS